MAKKIGTTGTTAPSGTTRPPRARGTRLTRDIGLGLPLPETTCEDPNCPYHGTLSVRGQIIEGTIVSNRMQGTVVVRREFMRLVPKYERYQKLSGRYLAHSPPCLDAKVGQAATIIECRPLSKAKSFVLVAVQGDQK